MVAMSSEGNYDLNSQLLVALRQRALDSTYVSLGGRRTASVHEFYRYPARFSPSFARAAIEAFTDEGDLVIDLFSGGGTSVVEAQLLGRFSVAADINPLATFVTTAKTTLYNDEAISNLQDFARAAHSLPIATAHGLGCEWAEQGYWRNISGPDTWRIRNLLLNGITVVEKLAEPGAQLLGRCALLRTGQWALDMRNAIPTVCEFRGQLARDIKLMSEAATVHRNLVIARWGEPQQPRVIEEGLPSSAARFQSAMARKPNLILTSPPYPGVYVNYHRWKVRGRRETPAPYWVANRLDGHGINRYTMSARNRDSSRLYFTKLREAFESLVSLMSTESWLVQVVGFNQGSAQFEPYLDVMREIGLDEVRLNALATEPDGRLWRDIPGRRWWVLAGTRAGTAPSTAREVVLIYRKR